MCTCLTNPPRTLDKIYYPDPKTPVAMTNNPLRQNNSTWKNSNHKKNVKCGNNNNALQYYYNNINGGNKNNFAKQTNAFVDKKNDFHTKAPFSSTKRPLSIRLATPKHVANFFNRAFRTDSQKRPLLLNSSHSNLNMMNEFRPNFQIIPGKSGLKISSIYTISENVEKFSLKNSIYRNKNLYISSNSRPLFVRK